MAQGGGARCVLGAFMLFVGFIAVGALIIAILAFVNINDEDDGAINGGNAAAQGGNPMSHGEEEIWTVHLGDDYGAYEFIDTDGTAKGFGKDVILAACSEAGIKCQTIVDAYDHCWTGQYPGIGLLSNWYVGCSGWLINNLRRQSLDFTEDFVKPPSARFFVQKGNPTNFDASDITGKEIGFRDSWASDPGCLSRQSTVTGRNLHPGSIEYFPLPPDGVQLLKDGQVDAIYLFTEDAQQYVDSGEIDVLPDKFPCQTEGQAIMVRKGSPFIAHFNRGLNKIKSNGKYKELCDKAKTEYDDHGTIDCMLLE